MLKPVINLLESARAELEAQQPLRGSIWTDGRKLRYVLKVGDKKERRYIRQADREEYQRRVRIGRALQLIEKALEELNGE